MVRATFWATFSQTHPVTLILSIPLYLVQCTLVERQVVEQQVVEFEFVERQVVICQLVT
jgi:inner membrane protein involved in colicin E2 resistance